MEISFKSDMDENMQNIRNKKNFDLMVFSSSKDYLCYVEAVHILQHEGKKRECDFIKDK